MKTIKVLSIVGLLAFNMTLLSKPTSATEAGESAIPKGLKSSINGVQFCSCPDDAFNCFCKIQEN